jgi:hypothetical protein
MARLPDAADLGERPSVRTGGGVASYSPVNTNAGLVGEKGALTAAARDLDQAALIVEATNAEQDRIAAEAAMNALQQQRVNLEFDPNNGFRSKKEGNAVGQPFSDGYMRQFDDASKSIADKLQNDRQRKLFAERVPVVGLQYRSALMQHQAAQTEAFNDSTADNTLKLTLNGMSQRPHDELSFQTGMVQIEATIDDTVKRKGLPPEAAKALKQRYTEAAYSTRILSVLEGIPGVVPSNPYLAEQMMRQNVTKLGPQALLTLSKQVTSGIKDVQVRDGARAEVYGNGPMDARTVYPAIEGVMPLHQVVQDLESKGARFTPDGRLLTSPKGAQGEMQVMPTTSRDPGFGVSPARNDSPDELARVGRDYIGAMTARYGDPALALAAYNAGPGQVDQWLAKYGDPRSGQISVDEWVKKIPFAETQKYVSDGLRKVAAAGGSTAPVSGPTANQIKAEAMPALLQRAREHAEAMYPSDPKFVDAYVTRTMAYANEVLNQQRARQSAAHDTLTSALVGQKGDGSDSVKSMDQVLANPTLKQAFETATPEAQLALQTRLAKGNKGFDAESFQIYYGLLGEAGQNPAGFAQSDLGKYYGLIPDEKLVELARYQKSINANDAKQQARDLNWQKAKSNVEDMLKPLGLGSTAKANSTKAKTTEQFYGRFNEALQTYYDENKKWPDTQTTRQFAAQLLTEGKQSGGVLWDSSTRAFEGDLKGFYVPLPAPRSEEHESIVKPLTQAYIAEYKRQPTNVELQALYTRWKLKQAKPGTAP